MDVRMLHASGIGTYIREMLPRVMTARPDLSYVLLGSRRESAGWPFVSKVNMEWVECNAPIFSLWEQFEILRAIPPETDLLWVPHFNIPLRYRGRLLVTVHDVFHLAQPQFSRWGLRRWGARVLLQTACLHASAILTPSQFTASEFQKYVGKPRSLAVTPLAAGREWFQKPKGPSPHPRPYFLFVGNVNPHKNLSGLLDAFFLIKDRLPHDLVIVGKREGFRLGDKRSTKRALSLGERVMFLGALELEDLKRWVGSAQAAILPSFYEGFGLPPLEAMALGTPVVVSDRASLPEVCGDAAMYVDPDRPASIANALDHLASDPALRESLIAKGRRHVRTFSWDTTLRKTLPVIEEHLRG
jgi:glycosyltransferase involved in cell wall biosynthesis